jgi:hypothetical protein
MSRYGPFLREWSHGCSTPNRGCTQGAGHLYKRSGSGAAIARAVDIGNCPTSTVRRFRFQYGGWSVFRRWRGGFQGAAGDCLDGAAALILSVRPLGRIASIRPHARGDRVRGGSRCARGSGQRRHRHPTAHRHTSRRPGSCCLVPGRYYGEGQRSSWASVGWHWSCWCSA